MNTALTAAFNTSVRERAALLVRAQRAFSDLRLDALEPLTDRQIGELVLKRVYGDGFELAGQSDSYVRGMLEHALEGAVGSEPKPGGAGETTPAAPAHSSTAVRADYVADWQRPLASSKQPPNAKSRNVPDWARPLASSKVHWTTGRD